MNQKKRLAIFDRLAEANPHPATELNYSTPFELLIAVVLSAQATDKGVNKATAKLFPIANTPQAMLSLGLESLKTYIQTINLYHGKAANIIKLCQQLLDKHAGQVPQTREELEALPGVGRKTASVILNTAFGQHAIAVDTHIFRVSNRTGIAPGKNVREVERKLEKWVPEKHRKDIHHLLILHGRYTCIARKPKCPVCVIEDLCEYKEKTTDLAENEMISRPARNSPRLVES
ncbi:endonuclease III DNA glycosylase/apyrimidinic (AP) lyase [Candidatus Methylobacter favarea]|uniref:Endonuclease III n=1 Tax=Candidatus Methylobacter favarea TaxID=2707345 RepID=A0A8S0X9B2_9GAMM|nr:endonuclease III [Candidatus Methylobacter favarea]CAA9892076.1 endonuclease III DNA glycosylase/apyrimidinic (AP) lyase [Candidatus Methylobacter favarea]